jgi:hypothetical protein
MAHDHDMLDAKPGDAEFKGSRCAMQKAVWPIGGTRLAIFRSTNSSPGPASKMTSGETRESQQPMSMILGDCPAAARCRNLSCSRANLPLRKAP